MAKGLLEKYNNLGKRERVILNMFIIVSIATGYYNLCYKPLSSQINTYKIKIQKLKTRYSNLESKFPSIDKQKENINSLKTQSDKLKQDIDQIESQLPGKNSLSGLIAAFASLAKNLELVSIQKRIQEGKDYSRLFIEFKFSSDYKDLVNYIRRLETLSPFLEISELSISEPKTKSKSESGPIIRLVLSTILSEVSTAKKIVAKETKDIEEIRDIFVSKSKPVVKVNRSTLRVEGITYSHKLSTAIINGDVVKVGSDIDDLKVKKILNDSVVLTDGFEEYVYYVSE